MRGGRKCGTRHILGVFAMIAPFPRHRVWRLRPIESTRSQNITEVAVVAGDVGCGGRRGRRAVAIGIAPGPMAPASTAGDAVVATLARRARWRWEQKLAGDA